MPKAAAKPPSQETRWRIELFGGLKACCGDRVVTHFETQKIGALLAYLAFHREQAHPRDALAEMLWPDEDIEAIRSRFRQALFALRRVLEPPNGPPQSVLMADKFGVRLNPEAVTTDVADFLTALRRAKSARETRERVEALSQAVSLYRGPLLPEYFEEWVVTEQGHLAEMFRQTLGELAKALAEQQNLTDAIEFARRAVEEDPLQEEAHRTLMRLFAQAGRGVDIRRQYRDLEETLKQEFGTTPDAATRALLHELLTATSLSAVVTDNAETSCPPGEVRLLQLEREGGAVPLDSAYYIERPTDVEFKAAIQRGDSIVLVKGPRQVGKTSLLARGLQEARAGGRRVVWTDFQQLNAAHLVSTDALFHRLAFSIADQLETEAPSENEWHPSRGPSENLERFLRKHVLKEAEAPLVWGLDEVDRLFACEFRDEIFGLFRSWHNQRAVNPDGPWQRLTLAIAYATEAHLFISDLNQSPFNVGTRLTLHDFAPEEVMELNRRYQSPLRDAPEILRFFRLVGGHPNLVRMGLRHMAETGADIGELEAQAEAEDGLFRDHLRDTFRAVERNPDLQEALRAILSGKSCPSPTTFFRLHSAGLVVGAKMEEARPRCHLYERYLRRYLP